MLTDIPLMTSIQSGINAGVVTSMVSLFMYIASIIIMHILKFRLDAIQIFSNMGILSSSESGNTFFAWFSFARMESRTCEHSAGLGAAIRIGRVLDLIGSMIFDVELQINISRILAEYFSIVLLKAACASLVSNSASLMTTTLNLFFGISLSLASS